MTSYAIYIKGQLVRQLYDVESAESALSRALELNPGARAEDVTVRTIGSRPPRQEPVRYCGCGERLTPGGHPTLCHDCL